MDENQLLKIKETKTGKGVTFPRVDVRKRKSSDQRERETARREMTLRERVSSREMLVLGSVLDLAKADAGRRQELGAVLLGELLRLKVGR
jgi:hypothetical protein